jgi:hypothetical protein
MKTESYLEVTGDLTPVYQEEEEQGQGDLSRSERDMEFVRRTMLTTQVQNVFLRIEMVGQDLILTASGDDAQLLQWSMRAFKLALARGMELLNHIGRHCKWPHMVSSKVASRINDIGKLPLEFATKRRMQMAPTTRAAECSTHVQWARGLIEMMHPAITTGDWSLMDCQEYFVDLETSLTGVATALEVSGPGQLRDDQMGTYRQLESEVGVAHGLANKLRAKHLENYDLLGIPMAAVGPSSRQPSAPPAKSSGPGDLIGRGLAVVLRPVGRPPVVQASMGGSCPTLSPRPLTRSVSRGPAQVLHDA